MNADFQFQTGALPPPRETGTTWMAALQCGRFQPPPAKWDQSRLLHLRKSAMKRPLSLAVAPLVWLFLATTLWAQADPLSVIPDDAWGVAVIRDISDTSARIGKLTQKMQIPAPDLLTLGKSYAGVEKGLNEKGSIAGAIFAHPTDENGFGFAIVVPVTDYKEFIGQFGPDDADAKISQIKILGEDALVTKKGEFAIFTDTDHKELLERFQASSKSVKSVVEPLGAWLGDQQVAVVATPAGKSVLFKKLLGLFPDADKVIEAGGDADAALAANMRSAMEMLQVFKTLLASADEQLSHLAVGVKIDDNTTLRIAARCLFVPEGRLAAWAKNVKLPSKDLLFGLPAGKFVLAYGGVSGQFSPEFAGLVNQFTDAGYRQMGLSKEGRKKAAAAMDRQRAGAIASCGLIAPIRPGDSVVAGAMSIERVKNSAEHLKITREMLGMMQADLKSKTTGEPIFEVSEVKVGDLEAIASVVNMTAISGVADADNPAAGFMQSFFSKLFGADGKIRTFMAAADTGTVVSAYTKEQLQRAVAHVRSGEKGLESDPQIAKTAALMAPGSQWVVYISPQGLLQWVGALLEGIIPAEAEFKMPGFPATEPIGLAARVSATGLDAEIVLPESVVAGIGQFVIGIQAMIQGIDRPPLP
jgi:hypothetical protein